MVIAIVILSILLILSIIYNILFTKGVVKLLDPETIEQKYNLIADYYEDANNIEESFPCCLLLHLQFNAKEFAKITDFSNYENSNIIAYSVLSKSPPPPGYANQLEKDSSIRMLIRNVRVNKYKDGEYFWEPM
jgi:hypothetical protein